jgi:hypothetical protein
MSMQLLKILICRVLQIRETCERMSDLNGKREFSLVRVQKGNYIS